MDSTRDVCTLCYGEKYNYIKCHNCHIMICRQCVLWRFTTMDRDSRDRCYHCTAPYSANNIGRLIHYEFTPMRVTHINADRPVAVAEPAVRVEITITDDEDDLAMFEAATNVTPPRRGNGRNRAPGSSRGVARNRNRGNVQAVRARNNRGGGTANRRPRVETVTYYTSGSSDSD